MAMTSAKQKRANTTGPPISSCLASEWSWSCPMVVSLNGWCKTKQPFAPIEVSQLTATNFFQFTCWLKWSFKWPTNEPMRDEKEKGKSSRLTLTT